MNHARKMATVAWFVQHNLPAPTPEFPFHPERNWRFDFAWPGARVALEIEGGIFGGVDPVTGRPYKGAHASVSGILRDMEKYSEGACLGWRIIRVLPAKLTTQPTVDLVRRALKWPR